MDKKLHTLSTVGGGREGGGEGGSGNDDDEFVYVRIVLDSLSRYGLRISSFSLLFFIL